MAQDAQDDGGGTRRRGGGKEVRRRLRGVVVLENVGWSSMEVEWRGRRGGGKRWDGGCAWKINRKEKKSNRRGYI
jgi:hypothetical protein